MNYEPVIGLEVHIELETASKMFCRCSTDYFTAKPNTHTCPVCLGLPGSMPVANSKAIEYAQRFGLALGCTLNLDSKFDRKNYFYPDLAKGFQISQYKLPFSQKGSIVIRVNGHTKRVSITRAHLEEDTGKLTHTRINGKDVTLIDFNRSGVPLLEIVSEPDISSVEEVKAYAQKLQQIARYLGVSDADMEKGSMRIEPNISLMEASRLSKGLPDYKVELKNINSFRFAQKATSYEIERQTKLLKSGQKLIQETRGWDEKKQETVSQRSKEEAHDYRYFPEPDLPPLTFNASYKDKIVAKIPELPDAKLARFKKDYQLSDYEAQLLTQDKDIALFFEETCKVYKKDYKKVVNWIIGELLRRLNESHKTVKEINLLPANLAKLLYFIDRGKITQSTAKEIFSKLLFNDQTISQVINKMGLKQLSQEDLIVVINEVIKENQKGVSDYFAGKEQSVRFLIGQVQRKTKGVVDPSMVRNLLLKKLKKGN